GPDFDGSTMLARRAVPGRMLPYTLIAQPL
ncbi:unnamed protein product, partial [marine sediment metagenome]